MEKFKKIRIFVASPSDCTGERIKLEAVVTALKPLADFSGVIIELVDWRKAVPEMGRPQQVIFNQMQPTTWDIFIGILWHRFGTPSGARDILNQRDYLSGTEEEFQTAYTLWKQYKKPRIIFYRCIRQIGLDILNIEQFQKVKSFFDQFDALKGEFPGLYQTYDSTESFEKLLIDNLQNILIAYHQEMIGRSFSKQEAEQIKHIQGDYQSLGHAGIPEADLFTTGNELIVEITIPGIKSGEIELTFENDTLTIAGKAPPAQTGATYLIQERIHGGFVRTIKLPVSVVVGRGKAVYLNGILRATFPLKK